LAICQAINAKDKLRGAKTYLSRHWSLEGRPVFQQYRCTNQGCHG